MIQLAKNGMETYLKEETYAIMAGLEKFDAEVLTQYPNLKVISRIGSGIDNIDEDHCKEHGIIIENTPDAPVQAVAEYVVYQILNYLRDYNTSTWQNKKMGKQLNNITVGIVGNGNIGSKVYNLLQPFGCEILIYDIIPDLADCGVEWLFHASDIITLHIPMCKGNYHFVGKKLLSCMKKEACLINTSRGDIIDEQSLYEQLVKKPNMTAILDVFSKEPYDGALKELKNVIMTPHIASSTYIAQFNMRSQAFENCRKHINKT